MCQTCGRDVESTGAVFCFSWFPVERIRYDLNMNRFFDRQTDGLSNSREVSLRSCRPLHWGLACLEAAHMHTHMHTHWGPCQIETWGDSSALCMNGRLLTLCCPHHDSLIMTELNCVCACVCVLLCVCIVKEREGENDRYIKAIMCIHVKHVNLVHVSACVCGWGHALEVLLRAEVYRQDVSSHWTLKVGCLHIARKRAPSFWESAETYVITHYNYVLCTSIQRSLTFHC